MTQPSTQRFEALLGNGSDAVTLARKEAHEIAQKLRARTGGSPSAERIESLLGRAGGGEVKLERSEAEAMLAELRESGRRWVFGETSGETPPEPSPGPIPDPLPEPTPPQPAPPEPLPPRPPPELGVRKRSLLRRLFSRE